MRPDPDRPAGVPIDWRGWIALAWAVGVGALYLKMMLERRAPGVLAALQASAHRLIGLFGTG